MEENRLRDETTNTALATTGWSVVRFWEHTPQEEAFSAIEKMLDTQGYQSLRAHKEER